MLEYWSTGVLEYWSAGVLECWSAGVLECWSAGVLECWSARLLECSDPDATLPYQSVGIESDIVSIILIATNHLPGQATHRETITIAQGITGVDRTRHS